MYPESYPPGTRCQYVFYGQRSERVRIRFEVIQLGNVDERYVYEHREYIKLLTVGWSSQCFHAPGVELSGR